MSQKILYLVIKKMHVKLNGIIENSNYNLLNSEVQQYSRRLDRAIVRYNRAMIKKKVPPSSVA